MCPGPVASNENCAALSKVSWLRTATTGAEETHSNHDFEHLMGRTGDKRTDKEPGHAQVDHHVHGSRDHVFERRSWSTKLSHGDECAAQLGLKVSRPPTTRCEALSLAATESGTTWQHLQVGKNHAHTVLHPILTLNFCAHTLCPVVRARREFSS